MRAQIARGKQMQAKTTPSKLCDNVTEQVEKEQLELTQLRSLATEVAKEIAILTTRQQAEAELMKLMKLQRNDLQADMNALAAKVHVAANARTHLQSEVDDLEKRKQGLIIGLNVKEQLQDDIRALEMRKKTMVTVLGQFEALKRRYDAAMARPGPIDGQCPPEATVTVTSVSTPETQDRQDRQDRQDGQDQNRRMSAKDIRHSLVRTRRRLEAVESGLVNGKPRVHPYKPRMRYTVDQKIHIYEEYVKGKPIGDVCQEYQITRDTFHKWRKLKETRQLEEQSNCSGCASDVLPQTASAAGDGNKSLAEDVTVTGIFAPTDISDDSS